MKTVAFIPVKLNSQRFPGKNTRKFSDGTPLITKMLQTLSAVAGLDEIYVFCSDAGIAEYLLPGIRYLERPAHLDAQEASPQDIISEFMKVVSADVYMACHCTSPFVRREHFEECIEAVRSGEYDSSFTAERVQRLFWTGRNEPLNFDPASVPRTQDLPAWYAEVSAAYAFRREVFQQYGRRIGMRPHVTVVSGAECVDIDYPEDFEIADAIYMRMMREGAK